MAATPPPQVLQWKYLPVRIVEARAKSPLMCIMTTSLKRPINYGNNDGDFKHSFLILPVLRLSRSFVCQGGLFSANYSKFRKKLRLKKYAGSLHEVLKRSEKIRRLVFVFVAGLMFVMSASLSVSGTPSSKFTLYGNGVMIME